VLGGLFVFFTLVAFQGVLLNLVPIRLFTRISLAVQGLLLASLLAGLPFVFSVPALYDRIDPLPSWSLYAPPLWFFGIDQIIFGNREPTITILARIAVFAVLASAAAAILTYVWSYRRHRIRVLESPSVDSAALRRLWPHSLIERMLTDARALGIFAFISKMLGRSRQHRLILTAFTAISLALISQEFEKIALVGSHFHTISPSIGGVRELIIAIPLGLSFLLLAGLRYLFRLPIEIQANWLFRTVEPGHALALLRALSYSSGPGARPACGCLDTTSRSQLTGNAYRCCCDNHVPVHLISLDRVSLVHVRKNPVHIVLPVRPPTSDRNRSQVFCGNGLLRLGICGSGELRDQNRNINGVVYCDPRCRMVAIAPCPARWTTD
jgi:hypothetical protein